MAFAIYNKKYRKWLCGTAWQEYPYKQRLSEKQCVLFDSKEAAELNVIIRGCGPEYEIVEIKPEEGDRK